MDVERVRNVLVGAAVGVLGGGILALTNDGIGFVVYWIAGAIVGGLVGNRITTVNRRKNGGPWDT